MADNSYNTELKCRQILSKHGIVILIDHEEYEYLIKYIWHICSWGYAVRPTRLNNKSVSYFMHRVITKCPKGMVVDHINGDKLDNRKLNLRVVTPAQNKMNIRKTKPNKWSKYKGTYYLKDQRRVKKWIAVVGGKRVGYFLTEKEAALAFNESASLKYGEFACLNVIED